MKLIESKTCSLCYSITAKPIKEDFINHLHNEYEILFFTRGKAEIIIGSKTYKMKKNDLFIIKPAVYHSVKILDENTTYERFVLNFSQSFIPDSAKPFFDDCFELYNLESDNLILSLISEWYAIKHSAFLTQDDDDVESYVKTFLLFLSSQKSDKKIAPVKANKTIEEIIRYIDENPSEQITAETLSKIFFVSKSYIIHSFKNHFGISLMNYVNKKRMLYAQRLITGGFTPAEVSEKLNYNDYSTFYRQYKKFIGVSPKSIM